MSEIDLEFYKSICLFSLLKMTEEEERIYNIAITAVALSIGMIAGLERHQHVFLTTKRL